jgi:D-alanyl-D-alanine carboxypeptidase/D-alanyl-D-alanine-endopeptidase (penicillin-binding protein 4)
MSFTKILLGVVLACLSGLSPAQALPPDVLAALARAKVPQDAVAVVLVDAQGKAAPRINHRSTVPMNPASVMKLVTTYAALDLLGPAYTWRTPVYIDGSVRDGVLKGNLTIRGQGDPKLVLERLWLLLRRVQGLGISHRLTVTSCSTAARGTCRSIDPASFDGEPLRPYNAAPDALLINFKSIVLTFVARARRHGGTGANGPTAGRGARARHRTAAGDRLHRLPRRVESRLQRPQPHSFRGRLPPWMRRTGVARGLRRPGQFCHPCGAGSVGQHGRQAHRQRAHGQCQRAGPANKVTLEPAFEVSSPPLAEIIRDINKYSNNVMAQQLFLTLSLQARDALGSPVNTVATRAASRAVVGNWWKERIQTDDAPVLDNGSGLSRHERISAQALGRLLQSAYRSPLMPELMASLPITGVDGTLKNRRAGPLGSAHLKTGSLRDVTAVAGYVHGASGKRYVLVAIANHPNASAARPAFGSLIEWAWKEN